MRYTKTLLVLCTIFFTEMGTGFAANSPKDSDALALLRGVELARSKYDNLYVELVLEYVDPTRKCPISCLVEQMGNRRRFEQFAGECLNTGIVALVNDHEVWGYRRKKYQDLDIYDMEYAVGTRGVTAFDPRIIGLNDVVTPADATVRQLLWIENCDQVKLLGRENLKGVPTWRVRATRDDTTVEHWIEEPSFRVHKCVAECPNIRVEINSEFDSQNRTFPFPKRVEVTRHDGEKWKQLTITVKSFEVDRPIPAERFTMKSFDLPVNTMINDYRIKCILGYWDGEGISKDPVYPGQKPKRSAPPPLPKRQNRLLLIALNVFVVLALVIAILWRWRRRLTSAK